MAIDPGEIAAGKCYITAGEQVRRVVGTRGADVLYEMRTRSMAPGSWGPKKTVSAINFAATVEREISAGEADPAPEPAAVPVPVAAAPMPADPTRDLIVEARDLLAAAASPSDRTDRLARLYTAADILVRAIEMVEQETQTDVA